MNNTWQVFLQFLLLGCTSFGGPAAHLAYFRERFVVRLGWLSEARYGQLIALSQFLPGPGSSQVGFAVGYHRAGLSGAVAAFIGFTTPSFIIMYALYVYGQSQHSVLTGATQGLKLLAVVVVLDAVVGMYRNFCTNKYYLWVGVATALLITVVGGIFIQLAVLLTVALLGAAFTRGNRTATRVSFQPNVLALTLFVVGLVVLPVVVSHHDALALMNSFYQSGSWVFGGGHVVLPLLQATVGDGIADERFLMAYGAAQAIPGPMFSLAAFLGAELYTVQPLLGALLALLAIFAPGLLLMLALQGTWQHLNTYPRVMAASAAVNAAVVGLLLAALYKPVILSGIDSTVTAIAAVVGYIVLVKYRPPIIVLVGAFAVLGVLLEYAA